MLFFSKLPSWFPLRISHWLFLCLRSSYWRRKWQPIPVFLSGEFHGQRSLAGYSPWSHKESYNDWATITHSWGAVIGLTNSLSFFVLLCKSPPYHLRLFLITQYKISMFSVSNYPFCPSNRASPISTEFSTPCQFLYSLAYLFIFSSVALLSFYSLKWNLWLDYAL